MNPELEFVIVTELARDRAAVKTENLFLAAQLISMKVQLLIEQSVMKIIGCRL